MNGTIQIGRPITNCNHKEDVFIECKEGTSFCGFEIFLDDSSDNYCFSLVQIKFASEYINCMSHIR